MKDRKRNNGNQSVNRLTGPGSRWRLFRLAGSTPDNTRPTPNLNVLTAVD